MIEVGQMLRRAGLVFLCGTLGVLGCCPDDDGSGGLSQGQLAIIQVTPDPISFSSVPIGSSETITVQIANAATASGELRVKGVALDTASTDFVLTQPAQLIMQPGEQTTVTITYTPSDDALDSGFLVVDYHSAQDGALRVPISTLQQVGSIHISPNPVAFTNVPGGVPTDQIVRISNQGSKPVEIGSSVMSFESSPDFKVTGSYLPTDGDCTTPAGPVEYPIILGVGGDTYCLTVTYTPFGGGSDTGKLHIFAPYDTGAPTQQPIAEAAVLGVEVGPEIALNPDALEFGDVDVNQPVKLSFFILNEGSDDLVINGLQKGAAQALAFDDISILTDIPAGTVIPADGDGLEVEVQFSPSTTYPITYGPLGYIEVLSNDGDEPKAFVGCFAQVAAPKLQVTPAEIVDFGVVANGKTAERNVTLTNQGTVDLIVEDLTVMAGENASANEYSFKSPPTLPITIPAAGNSVITLTFTNNGGAEDEKVKGLLNIKSNDPEGQTELPLRAIRTETAQCIIALEPETVNFGTVPYGKTKTMTVNLTNIGSSPCSFDRVGVHDGLSLFPGFPTQCTPYAGSESVSAGPSAVWTVTEHPPAIKDWIKPGQSEKIKLRFAPIGNIFSAISELTGYAGLLHVTVLDYANLDAGGQPTKVTYPEHNPADLAAPCNLQGGAGKAFLAAIPGEIDFGVTTVGCHSQTHTVKIYNTGTAPLSVCDIKLEGCTPETKLKDVPAIPGCVDDSGGLVLNGQGSEEVSVVYAPQDLTQDDCVLAIYENSDVPSLTISLQGSGTYDDEQTDVFTQLSGSKVDVLFVVDNSGSMSDEQSSLSSNFNSFISSAGAWDTDYHIGVVTTDMESANAMAGRLCGGGGGCKEGNPRFVTSANNNTSEFTKNVKVGDFGSGTEQGLMAAQTALSAPHISQVKPLQECTKDADCMGSAKCVDSMIDTGKKYCGGWNQEFLREDATLELVFVSDEEDSSTAQLSFYIDFFKSIKGFANENLFHAHAIVGGSGGCDGAGGSASDGQRYREVANETGGKFHSICDSNWSQKLQDIGEVAFGLKVQFFLSRPAIPDTVEVTVAGKVCNAGWTFQPDTNSVQFDPNHDCMPQEGEQIEIYYEVICYSE